MNRSRSLSSFLIIAVVAFAWSCGEDGWCSNGAFLNEESCVFAGHDWTPNPEPASCNAGDTVVEGQNPGDCQDGADNDMDGLFDCEDETCAGSPDCDDGGGGDDDTSGGGDDDTSGGGDDDTGGGPGDDDTGGGPGDDDTGGGPGGGNSESGQNCQPSNCPQCEDLLDNDGDGDIDCADADCSEYCGQGGGPGGGTATESGNDCLPASCPNCDDGVDNDQDGDIDCLDSDCDKWCGQ